MGFEIQLTSLEAKAKLGQNKSPADQQKLHRIMKNSPSTQQQILAQWMEQVLGPTLLE